MTFREETSSPKESSAGDGVVGYAILGCLIAGGIALFKAFFASTGIDTLLCTTGAVLAFSSVIWLYCWKRL